MHNFERIVSGVDSTNFTPAIVLARDVPKRLEAGYASSDRLGFVAMSTTVDDVTTPFLDTLLRRANEGAEVCFLPDSYGLVFPSDHLAIRPSLRAKVKELRELVYAVADSPHGRACFTYPYGNRGVYSTLPWGGRNHIKLYQMDDTLLTAGGVNATGNVYGFTDYLLEFKDPKMADWMWELNDALVTSPNLGDADMSLRTKYGQLLVDVGVSGQSYILDTAQQLLEQDDICEVVFCSMYKPGGKLESQLNELQKNLGHEKVLICYGDLKNPNALTDTLQSIKQRLAQKMHVATHPEHFVHAKFLIVRKANGEVTTISTSHNFNSTGVRLGTAEIALVSGSPELAHNLEVYLHKEVLRD